MEKKEGKCQIEATLARVAFGPGDICTNRKLKIAIDSFDWKMFPERNVEQT